MERLEIGVQSPVKSGFVAWLIILFIIIIFLGWVLLTPFEICVNSIDNDYHLKWTGFGEARVIVLPKDLLFRFRIAFWKKEYSIFEFKFKGDKKDPKEKKKKKSKKRNFKKSIRRIKQVLGSFTVKKLRLNIDTKNYILNGYLFPVFYHLTRFSKGKPQLMINYKGKTEINLLIRNRLINIFYAMMR
jgi:hypothetical protein